jgi:predicted nucleotide-binding protein (sugar kinase/HSP70/actin superfamily)
MSYATARLAAACFRALGIDATVVPDSDEHTLELSGPYTSGEECLPHRVTLGDFLKVCRAPDFDPQKTAFFMPSAEGPCRFGQYAPYLRHVLNDLGYGDVLVVTPNSENAYDGIGDHSGELVHTLWMAIVLGDLISRFLLKTRPYEINAGESDACFQQAIRSLGEILEIPGLPPKERLQRLVGGVQGVRDRFRAVPANYVKGRPLIGVVGEIFCRLHEFSNEDLTRRVERLGGECWLSHVPEWIWYTNWAHEADLIRERGRLNLEYLKQKLKAHYQHQYEQALLAPVHDDFKGYEEPHDIRQVLDPAEPYLPSQGALGEMVLSVGKAIYLYGKGADGVIDISPFTCMNGIVSEAIYPAVSAEHDDIPIRVCYFDKTSTNIDRDLEIFLDLARAYQRRKRRPRAYPDYFD